jgi:hypothetical protein
MCFQLVPHFEEMLTKVFVVSVYLICEFMGFFLLGDFVEHFLF